MQLSDIHVGHPRGRKYLEKIVEETNQRKPDIVLITGDLIDSEAAFVPGGLEPLARFSAPVYYVGGNHETYVDAERAFALVKKYGVNVLRSRVVETHGLQLVSLDYMNADEDTFDLHPSDDSRTIKSVRASLHLKDSMPSVLLDHSPAGAQHAAANGIDLTIAGHTHCGPFFPGTLVAPAIRQGDPDLTVTRVLPVKGAVAPCGDARPEFLRSGAQSRVLGLPDDERHGRNGSPPNTIPHWRAVPDWECQIVRLGHRPPTASTPSCPEQSAPVAEEE